MLFNVFRAFIRPFRKLFDSAKSRWQAHRRTVALRKLLAIANQAKSQAKSQSKT